MGFLRRLIGCGAVRVNRNTRGYLSRANSFGPLARRFLDERRIASVALAMLLSACGGSVTAVPTPSPAPPAFGQPFLVDGYRVDLISLRTIESFPGGVQSNPGQQLYARKQGLIRLDQRPVW